MTSPKTISWIFFGDEIISVKKSAINSYYCRTLQYFQEQTCPQTLSSLLNYCWCCIWLFLLNLKNMKMVSLETLKTFIYLQQNFFARSFFSVKLSCSLGSIPTILLNTSSTTEILYHGLHKTALLKISKNILPDVFDVSFLIPMLMQLTNGCWCLYADIEISEWWY